jgi:hypothetical protein
MPLKKTNNRLKTAAESTRPTTLALNDAIRAALARAAEAHSESPSALARVLLTEGLARQGFMPMGIEESR